MITVDGDQDDYAIMKQVQQLSLKYPQMAIVPLNAQTDFSRLGADEALYLVGHGNIFDGDFKNIKRSDLLGWLAGRPGPWRTAEIRRRLHPVLLQRS